LRPKGAYIGVSEEPGDARSEAEAPLASGEALDNPEPVEFDDLPEGMDLEDLLEATEDDTVKEDTFLMVEGKKYHKSSIVTACLTSNRARKVIMRTLQARGVTLDDLWRRPDNIRN
jgi:hypothetical protein